MTSVPQPTHDTSGERAGDDLTDIELWFARKGVPQFVAHYSPRKNMKVLVFLLLTVVAFDLAIQPWVGLNAWFLLIAPAVLVCSVLVVKIAIVDQAARASHLLFLLIFGPLQEYRQDLRGWRRARREARLWRTVWREARIWWKVWAQLLVRSTVLFAGLYLLGRMVFLLDRETYWADRPMAFLVIVGLLWTSRRLFQKACWEGDEATHRKRRLRLYLVVAGAVLYFALDGNALPSSTTLMDGVVGGAVPAAKPVPGALAAVVVTAIIMLQSRGLIREPGEQGAASTRQFNPFFPAVPLLILLLCAETTVLPYLDRDPDLDRDVGRAETVTPLILMALVVPLHVLSQWRPPRNLRVPKVLRRIGSDPGLALFVVLYLVIYPVMVGVLSASERDEFSIDAFGTAATGRSAFLLAFGINLLYLLIAWVIAGFGLDRVAVWATKEAWTNWLERISNLGRGLSILLVVSTFLLLTAEVWETVTKVTTRTYFVLVGALLVLTGAFHLLTSVQQLTRRCQFDKWSDVVEAATASRKPARKWQGDDDAASDPEIDKLLSQVELGDLRSDPGQKAPDRAMGKREMINAVMVMMTYEILFFIPVMLIAAVSFFALGQLTVSPDVAAMWVFGDNAPDWRADELATLPLPRQPWIRVAGLLAVFSVLYLAVEVLSDPDKHQSFFEGTDNALRRRLAVRLAYREVLARREAQRRRPAEVLSGSSSGP